ncbi:MAG: 2-hydroxyacid dehydrogenase [Pseudomonadota bacterium]
MAKPILMAMLPLYEPAMAALEQEYELLRPWDAPDPTAFIRDNGLRVRGVVTTTSKGFLREEFDAFPHVEVLACYGPYVTLVDLARARERGIPVSYTPDMTAEPVADLALGLMLATMRRLSEADRFVRAGLWPKQAFPAGREVHHKRCGIVGMGRIGQQIAKRAAAFDMAVSYYGPRAKDGLPYTFVADLQELARKTDCLVVTCALTPQTRGLVDAAVLDALGPDGFLVNIARGPIVDEAALVRALAEKRIAGAGLDVFADEPHVPAELLAMDQVVLAPHIGTSTKENRDERMRKMLANLRAHFTHAPVPYPVPETV